MKTYLLSRLVIKEGEAGQRVMAVPPSQAEAEHPLAQAENQVPMGEARKGFLRNYLASYCRSLCPAEERVLERNPLDYHRLELVPQPYLLHLSPQWPPSPSLRP